MNQPEMRPIPKAARTLALLSAVGFALAALVRIACILNPAITAGLFLPTDASTEVPFFATCGMVGISLLTLPLLILTIQCAGCKQISSSSAKLYAVLFGCFLPLPLTSGLCGSAITTLTARLAGAEALATLSAMQIVIGFTDPMNTISYVLLGCSVAIIAYAATQQNDSPTA
ncbi:MAG: hypothetical protein PUC41_05000 [Oscillospiraceae bacterium]|nr:hypothetical protein [Oscillospiraceae bacterium]